MVDQKQSTYPYAELSIPCPAKSDRVSAFLRVFYAVPILILLVLLIGVNPGKGVYVGGGFLFLPIMFTILLAHKYPKAWFDWIYYLTKLSTRVFAYLLLLRDEYPSLEDDQFVRLYLRYPSAPTELHRGMPLIKWLSAIPHYVVLVLLFLAVMVVTLLAWFSILATGKYPLSIHAFVVGVLRWSLRVDAYAFLLLTDKYPPFSLLP